MILIFHLLSVISLTFNSVGYEDVVGVGNAPPLFDNIEVDSTTARIKLVIADANGWDDIYDVRVIITYNRNITVDFYLQIQESRDVNNKNLTHNYTAYVGKLKPHNQSDPSGTNDYRYSGSDSWRDKTTYIVQFVYEQVEGSFINITVHDKGNLTASYMGPYISIPTKPPSDPIGVVINAATSLVIATVFTIIIVMHRHNSNKLAKFVESKKLEEMGIKK